jgi:uncharacterized membrane protein
MYPNSFMREATKSREKEMSDKASKRLIREATYGFTVATGIVLVLLGVALAMTF